jgi:hypothetical protein
MPRVISIHEFELKPGVTEAEFEDAVRAFILVDQSEGGGGALTSLIKSDRGTRRGQYGLLIEFESVEARDSWFTDDGPTEKANQFFARHPEWMPAWEHIQSLAVEPHPWSDYLVL